MGKRGRNGGGGGGGRAPPGPPAGEGFVVVNPALLQSAPSAPASTTKEGAKKGNNKAPAGQRGKKKRRAGHDALVVAGKPTEGQQKEEGRSVKTLRVKSNAELLAGVYWLLLSRRPLRSCVVVLPTGWGGAQATSVQQFAGMCKHLGFQSLALHGKMTGGQRKANVDRLAERSSDGVASDPAAQLVLVTTEQLAASAATRRADVILIGDASSRLGSKFARVFHVVASTIDEEVGTPFIPALSAAKVVQQLQTRLKLARQVADLSQRVGQSSIADQDDKWAAKMAKGADLADSDDDSGRKQSKKKKRKLTPDEQRLQALTDKLFVLLASPVQAESSAVANDAQHRADKLRVLGLVTIGASVGTAMTEERTAAQTQWMDGASGERFGGSWAGAVRHGASKDDASLTLRRQLVSSLEPRSSSDFLSQWRPNKQPSDASDWGGAYGKACGHNEVVMQLLRPFSPQEVLNSRVCSRLHPAPGNQGFDGCLEHLRLSCAARGESMTVWDGDAFVHLTASGRVTRTSKRQLLALPLAALQCLVPALRAWTVASNGRLPLNAVLLAVQLCCRLGTGQTRGKVLNGDVKVAKRVMSFLLGGSARLWKQIAAFPAPLECQTVYEELASM